MGRELNRGRLLAQFSDAFAWIKQSPKSSRWKTFGDLRSRENEHLNFRYIKTHFDHQVSLKISYPDQNYLSFSKTILFSLLYSNLPDCAILLYLIDPSQYRHFLSMLLYFNYISLRIYRCDGMHVKAKH